MDPHTAIAYRGLVDHARRLGSGQIGVFLSTAHPAKFREIVEPIIGRRVETPKPLADALAGPRHVLRIAASLEAVGAALDA